MNIVWTPGMSLEDAEKQIIKFAMRFHQNNKTHASKSLKIAYRTLDDKLKKYDEEQKQLEQRMIEKDKKNEQMLRRARGLPVQQDEGLPQKQSVPVRKRKKVQEVPLLENSNVCSDTEETKGND